MKPFSFEMEKTKKIGPLTSGTFSKSGVKGYFTVHGNRVKITVEEKLFFVKKSYVEKKLREALG